MKDFYVYEHWRPDTNSCFYVGKGRKKRALNMLNRNPHHKNVQKKLNDSNLKVEVKIIFKNLSNEEAEILEFEQIIFYGIENLCNKSLGPSGCVGYTHTEEAKRKISSNHKISERVKKHVAMLSVLNKGNTHCKGRSLSLEHKAKLSKALIGNKNNLGKKASEETKSKMSFAKKGRAPSSLAIEQATKSKMKPVICLDDQRSFLSIKEAMVFYGIKGSGNVSSVCNGRRATVAGRRFVYAARAS
jgi:hypothetical protein